MWLKRMLVVVFSLVPIINYGSFLLPGAMDQFSNDASTRVDAAGYAFSIWGFIFVGMLAFAVHVLRSENNHPSLRRACKALIVAGIASILFVPISIYGNQVAVWCDILMHLIPLVIAVMALRDYTRNCSSKSIGRWTFVGPSMYLGWISAAFVISTAMMLNDLQISLPENAATLVACTVLLAIAGIAVRMTRTDDPIYGLTIAWALVAVGIEQVAYPPIRWTAWIAAGFLLVILTATNIAGVRFYPLGQSQNDLAERIQFD